MSSVTLPGAIRRGSLLACTIAAFVTYRASATAATLPLDHAGSSRVTIGMSGTPVVIDDHEVWRAGATYEIAAPVVIVAGGTLVIEPGTRVEARPGASLDVTEAGRLIANGTLLQPIVLTCTSAPKYAGCWDGVILRGFGRVNLGTPTSPPDRGTGAAGCLETGTGLARYGGCDDADSSGVLRYVRVEYATRGMQLLGVGSSTLIDHVQVTRSFADGVAISGGTVDLRHMFLTANAGYGLTWRSGWRGRGQYLLVQQDGLRNAGGIRGSNLGSNPNVFVSLPRSAPSLYNVTIVAPSAPSNPLASLAPSALHLTEGTGGIFRNVLVFGSSIGFDIDDNYTCLDVDTTPPASLANVVVAGTAQPGHPDNDSLLCGAYQSPNVEAQWLADPANASVIITDPTVAAALVRNGTDLVVPDLRPLIGGATSTNPIAAPPNDGFFDVSANYIGAVEPGSATRGNIPWYSGWTSDAPPLPLPGSAQGVVASTTLGPLPGVTVVAAFGATTVTALNGTFTLPLPAGVHLITATGVPIGCTATPVTITVPSGVVSTANIDVRCTTAAAVAAGAAHACALTVDDQVQCWGQNDYGMVGDGTTDSPRPLPVLSGANLTYSPGTLTSGYSHTCALRSGAALCWGLNFFGALGLGSSGLSATTPVAAGNTQTPLFVALSAGGYHSCALTGAGEPWCWGWNQEGQVGVASPATVVTPTAVNAGGLSFAQLSSGESHTCALTSAGVAYCWGGNGRGELGSDPASAGTSSATPLLVPGGLVFASIDAGTQHTCALTATGEAFCWGSREYGQLGDGQVGGSSVGPVAVSTTDRFTKLAAGGYTTCGVTTTQQLRCWGAGQSGALGNGTQTAAQATPVAVSGSLTAASVAVNLSEAQSALACATTTTGAAYCWGAGASGQLGSGTLVPTSTTPVQVRLRGP